MRKWTHTKQSIWAEFAFFSIVRFGLRCVQYPVMTVMLIYETSNMKHCFVVRHSIQCCLTVQSTHCTTGWNLLHIPCDDCNRLRKFLAHTEVSRVWSRYFFQYFIYSIASKPSFYRRNTQRFQWSSNKHIHRSFNVLFCGIRTSNSRFFLYHWYFSFPTVFYEHF